LAQFFNDTRQLDPLFFARRLRSELGNIGNLFAESP